MAKPPTFPTLYDDCKKISISDLKRWGHLNPNSYKSSTLTFSSNGNKTGSISIRVNTQPESPYLELDYNCNEAPINYRVQLVSIPSNIGKGLVWYFICPHTGKRCRKLHLADTYFYHRSAFNGCMYESQTQSKKYREMDKTLGACFKSDSLYSELYKKHFKKTYAGKPTKRYLRIIEQIRQAESVPYHEIERALMS